ncbi:hypothetical protein SNOG_08850 [Parastagonospora nodorum SN15]|uniref:Uncharacterized protein n=1 Tax=Phaeosphaeria nodorum (strain SN15 / ATCC MYA-4574 / FGSC 10173) TaxID=321614 RepID=Q0UHB4_PHANO|nr:hypothetical protein SNOG_08850 [Parastagonospora nodorum SN15]EAT84018.1 hypothetical protein SNOG_08850 [Parastagonospora nodorum SN15]
MFVQYVLIFIGEQAEIVAEKQLEGRSLETTDEVGNEFKDAPLVLKEHFAAELWPEIQGTVTTKFATKELLCLADLYQGIIASRRARNIIADRRRIKNAQQNHRTHCALNCGKEKRADKVLANFEA